MKFDFTNLKVLLIGDFMIDQYIFGSSNRMSPEAPVPVMITNKDYSKPGGAGNVAVNLSALGAKVSCIGYIGNDKEGRELIKLLNERNINTDRIDSFNTITTAKKRFYIDEKQFLRIDNEKIIMDWKPKNYSNINYKDFDIIILSDYNKGVLNNNWFTEIDFNNIFVDPKKDDFSFYSNAKIITPNLNELQRASGLKITDNDLLESACKKILDDTNLEFIIAKNGENGMSIFNDSGLIKHFEAHKVFNPDVTGAGDTVIATFALTYTYTKDIEVAAKYANKAASLVVSKSGTATVTIDDINNYILSV